ncbi:MAG: helix-turn-helix domain-containing protein [Chloroflexi bacterium]|nr:helix-turn-helix domain-containing protein [Chloroflexota bacterium]
MDQDKGYYSDWIRSLRGRLRLTQDQFARLVGVNFVTVSRWENGSVCPNRLAVNALTRLAADGNRYDAPAAPAGPAALALDDDSIAGAFRRSSIFSDLDERHLVQLSRLAVERDLKAGQFLFFEGEPVRSSYLVVSGILKLVKHSTSGIDVITGIFGQGEMLVNVLLFVGKAHTSSAQAVVDTRVLAINGGDLIAFLHQDPALSTRILGRMLTVAGQRHNAAIVRLSELAGERMEYRLARVLLALYLGLGPSIPLTRREIAEMTGTTTETTSRFISRLTRAGIVQSLRGKVIVTDHGRLRELAEAS